MYKYINCTCIYTLIMKRVCEISMMPMCFDTRVACDVKYVVSRIVLTLKYRYMCYVFNKKGQLLILKKMGKKILIQL